MRLIILNTIEINTTQDLKDLETKIGQTAGWEEGSYTVGKMTFSDDTYIIVCDYPTDLTELEAQKILDSIT